MGLKIQAPTEPTSVADPVPEKPPIPPAPFIQEQGIEESEPLEIGIKESDKDELGDPNVGFTPADSFIDRPFEDFNYDMTELGLEISLYFSPLGCYLVWKNTDFIPFERVKFDEKFISLSMDDDTPPVKLLTTSLQVQEIMKLMKLHEGYFLSQ